jgi:c-di-GMP-binding flagellar brake protein YcgR
MSTAVFDSNEVHPKRSSGSLVLAMARQAVAVEVNDLLQIQLPDQPSLLSFRSRVDDIIADRVQIAWPTDGGVLVPIHKHQTLTMSFVRDDAIYTFSGIVEELKQRPLAQLSVATVGRPERIQRRQYFRVKSVQPVELFGEQPNNEDERQPPKVIAIKTITFEISGSGLSIRHGISVPPGTLLDCKLFLASEDATIKILCKVVHSSRISPGTEAALYHIGMFFLSINEADRTRIVRHVFRVEVC